MPINWNASNAITISTNTTFTASTAGTYGNNVVYTYDGKILKADSYPSHFLDLEEEPDEPALWELI